MPDPSPRRSDHGAWKRGTFWLVPVNDTTGVIIDTRTERVFPPIPLVTALARGYWEEIETYA
jgi:hypothetical protein